MINSTELRIGNLVNGEDKIISVESITDTGINLDVVSDAGFSGITFVNETISFKLIQPISLTEDWLLKFNFENGIINSFRGNEKTGYHKIFHPKNFPYSLGEPLNILIEEEGYFMIGIRQFNIAKINYVHQLQNLYFILTGEELTIKETENQI